MTTQPDLQIKNESTADDLIRHALWLRNEGDYVGACQDIGQAITILERVTPADSALLPHLVLLAETAVDGHLTESSFFAASDFDAAIARISLIIDKSPQSDSKYAAILHWFLARRFEHQHDDDHAIESARRALEIYRSMKTEPLAERRCLSLLARVYARRNEPDQVEACYLAALALDGPDIGHPDELSDDLQVVANFYIERKELQRGETLLERALTLKRLSTRHPHTAIEILEEKIERVRALMRPEEERFLTPPPDVLGDLKNLVGLEAVKRIIHEHAVYMEFLRLRTERGFKSGETAYLHAAFIGNPGTGKTTVARLLGQLYQRLGLLSKGHVVSVTRADLVGIEYGAAEKKTQEALDDAQGGVLFIDEAYSLTRRYRDGDIDYRDPGQQVIETLLPAMSEADRDIAIIFAGYPKEMETFLDSNPGLRSRLKLHVSFPDYTPPEMLDIALKSAGQNQLKIDNKAQNVLLEEFEHMYRARNQFSGNARYVNSLLDDCKRSLGVRIMSKTNAAVSTNDELSLITEKDVRTAIGAHHAITYRAPLNEKMLAEILKELNSLAGLEEVKAAVDELVKVVRLYRQLGKDVLTAFKLHAVFTGNPGTGKTTVARLMARVYAALGILERGHLVECDRSALVGEYIGVTESLTKAKIAEAMGGVLFIDEAYALAGSQRDFGPRAIEVLLKEMEDKRGQFFVILAGYKEEMQQLLDMNPGLRSRIEQTVNFTDFTMDELEGIATSMFQQHGLVVHREALEALRDKLRTIKQMKTFANARSVRKLVEKAVMKHFARLADIPETERKSELLSTIHAQEIEQTVLDEADMRKFGY